MTVQIDWARSRIPADGGEGSLFLVNSATGDDYHHWPFYDDPERADEFSATGDTNAWHWENPDDDPQDITLSPSLKYDGGIGPNFHIFVRDGEIEHCGDCKCGCNEGS